MKILSNNCAEVELINNILSCKIINNYSIAEKDYEEFIEVLKNTYQAYLMENKKFSFLLDLRHYETIPLIPDIMSVINFFKNNREKTMKVLWGTSVITDNKLIIHLFDLIFSMYESIKPIKMLKTYNEARQFITSLENMDN